MENNNQSEQLIMEGEHEVLKALATGSSLSDVLSRLALMVEKQYDGAVCSISIFDEDKQQVKLGASPSLPSSYTAAFAEISAFCYAKAAEERKLIIVNDVMKQLSGSAFQKIAAFLQLKSLWISPIINIEGNILGVISIFHTCQIEPRANYMKILSDIVNMAVLTIEKYKSDKKMRQMAYYDTLTGLPNRRLLILKIEKTIFEAKKHNQKYAIVYINCDRFKMLNDAFNQYTGDIILKQFGSKLENVLCEGDVIGRLYGDEFIILLNQVETEEVIEKKVQKITEIFKKPWFTSGQEFYLTASMGIVKFPLNDETPEQLLKMAETALRQAKREGRNRVVYYKSEGSPTTINRLILEKDLRYALERDELLIYYQPQVNIVTGEVIGAEALLRWNHPDHGLISPGEFIPILDDTGMINPIGEWLIEKACFQQVQWLEKGFFPISISVNISPVQFKSAHLLVAAVNKAIAASGIDPKYLKLEITENMLIHNITETLETLKKLKHVGIGVSIDDFGTGYSSLSYLKKFPVETIKIDRSFIKDIDFDIHDQAIVKAIIDMARGLQLDLIAEGTETDKQIYYLKTAGCQNVQGFYFSKPVTPSEFEKQLSLWGKIAKKLSWEIAKREIST